MRLELVSIPTDTASLDGLYYEPGGGATAGAALLFHGNTMNFYTGALRFLPPVLAVRHVADHPRTPALVLLSAHGGGRGVVQRSSRAGTMARDRVEELTAQARAMVAEGRGRELMLMPGWWYAISAESFLDRLTETPDVLELAPKIQCPTLFVRGDRESLEQYPAEEFISRMGPTTWHRPLRIVATLSNHRH